MLLTARETVAMETHARFATSRMLTAPTRRRLVAFFLGAVTMDDSTPFLSVSRKEFIGELGIKSPQNPRFHGLEPWRYGWKTARRGVNCGAWGKRFLRIAAGRNQIRDECGCRRRLPTH